MQNSQRGRKKVDHHFFGTTMTSQIGQYLICEDIVGNWNYMMYIRVGPFEKIFEI